MGLSLEKIKITLNLYKEAFNKSHVSVADLSKELGVKVTELMGYIKDNKIFFELFKSTGGILIGNVFLKLEEVKGTDEYVKFMKDKYKDTIFLETFKYHSVELCKSLVFKGKSDDRFDEWANTPDKVEKIKDHLYTYVNIPSAYLDTRIEVPNSIDSSEIQNLISEGWKILIDYK